MKSHERKAIERAASYYYYEAINQRINIEGPGGLARKIVNLAQIRAGRTYDHNTELEALELALSEAKLIIADAERYL